MKSTSFALTAAILATTAVAQPHRHQQLHQKRQDVAWVTDWDYVTNTVDVTTTIFVPPGFVPPTAAASSSAASSSGEAAQFFQGASSSADGSFTSTVYVDPPAASSTSAAAAAAPVETSSPAEVDPTTSAAAAAPVASTTAAAAPAVAATTSAAAAGAATSAASSGTSGGSGGASSGCTSGSPCTGDMTYYQAGLGACGWTNDGDTENIVALPHGLMGTQSNGNPYCGQMITIECVATGKTTTAKVVDKCMGCEGDSIDLSNAAFLDLDDLAVGRTTAKWYFN